MNKIIIIAGVVVLVAVGGVGAFVLTRDDSDSQTNSQNSGDTQQQEGTDEVASQFEAVSNDGTDLTATITVDGKQLGVFEQDGDKSRFELTSEGQTGEFIYTPEATYSCTNGECYKFPSDSDNANAFDTEQFSYDTEKLNSYRDGSNYVGRESCPAGTCDVWTITEALGSGKVYIDVDTKRVSKVEGNYEGKTSVLEFTYQDVTIEVPTNAKTLPTL